MLNPPWVRSLSRPSTSWILIRLVHLVVPRTSLSLIPLLVEPVPSLAEISPRSMISARSQVLPRLTVSSNFQVQCQSCLLTNSSPETNLEFTLPGAADVGTKCQKPGDCVVQLFWATPDLTQNYYYCTFFSSLASFCCTDHFQRR